MNTQEARAVVGEILSGIAPEIDLAAVPPDAHLREELDLDSMDFLSLMQGIADRTGVEIPEAHYEQVETLQHLTDYLVDRATVPSA